MTWNLELETWNPSEDIEDIKQTSSREVAERRLADGSPVAMLATLGGSVAGKKVQPWFNWRICDGLSGSKV